MKTEKYIILPVCAHAVRMRDGYDPKKVVYPSSRAHVYDSVQHTYIYMCKNANGAIYTCGYTRVYSTTTHIEYLTQDPSGRVLHTADFGGAAARRAAGPPLTLAARRRRRGPARRAIGLGSRHVCGARVLPILVAIYI